MTAVVTLNQVLVDEAHEDGLWIGDAEWKLVVEVNGQAKTFKDGSVRDGEYLSLGTDRTWTLDDVVPGESLTFRVRAWEEDPWPNPDDYLGRVDTTLSTSGASPFYINEDYEIDAGDYEMSFEVFVI